MCRSVVMIVVFTSAWLLPLTVEAVPITTPLFFTSADVTIDFESVPGSPGVPPSGTALTNQYTSLGVSLFRSEDVLNTLQTTDAADASGRFEDPFRILETQGLGGAPQSGVRYASGDVHLGQNTSDMRIDFASPVIAFGFWVIDNDFTDVRIAAYSAAGALIETLIVPEVAEGGFGYHGIAAPGISYLIIDGQDGVRLDSTFIDDLSFRVAPEPGLLSLLGCGILLLAAMRASTIVCVQASRSAWARGRRRASRSFGCRPRAESNSRPSRCASSSSTSAASRSPRRKPSLHRSAGLPSTTFCPRA